MLKEAMERAFGPVDTVSLRRKGAGKHSWAFVTMHNHDSVLRAVCKAELQVKVGTSTCSRPLLTGLRCSHRSPLCQDPEYGETSILAIEPVALKKELKNASGALADVWRKTLAKTSHGKHLNLFRQKIESRCAQSLARQPSSLHCLVPHIPDRTIPNDARSAWE